MTPVHRPLWQRFSLFLVPLMASNILQALSGTINNIYIGQLIGVDALAAVAAFFPLMFFLMSFIIGLASGSTVLIGQAWGAKNTDKVKQVAGTTITVTFPADYSVDYLKGKEATFVIFLTPDEGRGLPLSLEGFEKGFGLLQ